MLETYNDDVEQLLRASEKGRVEVAPTVREVCRCLKTGNL